MLALLSCMILAGNIESEIKNMIGGEAEVSQCEIRYSEGIVNLELESKIKFDNDRATIHFFNLGEKKCATQKADFFIVDASSDSFKKTLMIFRKEIIKSQIPIGDKIFNDMRSEDSEWNDYCSSLDNQ